MKGQVSVEFMALLALALLGSSILVTALNNRAVQYSKASPYAEAESLAQRIAYDLDYAVSEQNTSVEIGFSPRLEEEYNVSVFSGQVVVDFDTGNASFPTLYSGSRISFNSSKTYTVSYNGTDIRVES